MLQPLRYLHDCSDCFRLERLPGGACTHWKAPPFHGAHPERTLGRRDLTLQNRYAGPEPFARLSSFWAAIGCAVASQGHPAKAAAGLRKLATAPQMGMVRSPQLT